MPTPPRKLTGNSPLAIWLNQLLAYIVSLTPVRSINNRVEHTSRGVAIKGNPKGGPPAEGEGFYWG